MMFFIDTAGDDYEKDDADKLKKLGFRFKHLRDHERGLCKVFEYRKRARVRMELKNIKELMQLQKECGCPLEIDGTNILIIDQRGYSE